MISEALPWGFSVKPVSLMAEDDDNDDKDVSEQAGRMAQKGWDKAKGLFKEGKPDHKRGQVGIKEATEHPEHKEEWE